MDISSEKDAKSHMENFTRRISSDRSTKQRHKNYVKTRIEKTQYNSRCGLFDDRDEQINLIISDCSKFAQREYKTSHDWVGRVIHRDFSK